MPQRGWGKFAFRVELDWNNPIFGAGTLKQYDPKTVRDVFVAAFRDALELFQCRLEVASTVCLDADTRVIKSRRRGMDEEGGGKHPLFGQKSGRVGLT